MSVALKLWRVLEKFDPRQLRDPHTGEWSKDVMGLAGRIQLAPGERLVSSDRIRGLDADMTFAVVHSPHGNHVRLGVIPLEDSDKWRAGNRGGTSLLDTEGLDDLRDQLTEANKRAKKLAGDADRAWDSGGPPEDPALLGVQAVVEGRVFSDWSDVFYSVWLDDSEPTGWTTTIQINPGDQPAEDESGIRFEPKELAKLLKRLNGIEGELGASVSGAVEGGLTPRPTALELWRTLEAWDSKVGRYRIDKGMPGAGRFMPTPGGSGDRPSLADVVRGTAAGGPKRLRSDKGGMSVADAVRAAARRSDTTGRPTHRPPAEHRAHGAHDVADEVDRALADGGVSEDVRRKVSGRARAAADSHGARPDSLPKPSKKIQKLTDEQLANGITMRGTDSPEGRQLVAEQQRRAPAAPRAAVSDAEVARQKLDAAKADIRAAVRRLQTEPDSPVSLVRLRNELGEGHNRHNVDQALKELSREQDIHLIPEINQKVLTQADRDSAVQFGGQDQHHVMITPKAAGPKAPAPRTADPLAAADRLRAPSPAAPKPKPRRTGKPLDHARALEIAAQLTAATSRDQARRHLDGLTVPQLRQIAAATGATVGSNYPKPKIVDSIVNWSTGRRLDSEAIQKMARGH